MAFPRTSEGLLDIEAYVNLSVVNPEAAKLMLNELKNEDQDTINYFFDNVDRVIEEVRRKNNEELAKLDMRRQELDAQKRVYVAAYERSMQDTLADARTKEGRLLTSSEKETLNRELAQEEINLLQQPSVPQKTEAQLLKEEQKRRIAALREKVALGKAEEAKNNPQLHATPQQTTTNHNKTPKNRGCTIF